MDLSVDVRARRRLIALFASGVVLLILIGFGTYGLLFRGADRNDPAADPSHSEATAPHDPQPTEQRPQLTTIQPTRDSETFALRVATALFTWDTASGLTPLDYSSVLLEVGDPTGVEQAGLAADVASYLPTRDAWKQLQPYSTTQWIEIESTTVPATWSDAVAQARPGQLPPGATAYTVEGTRQRDGVWDDEPVTAQEPVSFTVFIACPDGDACYLLRLSRLNDPLK